MSDFASTGKEEIAAKFISVATFHHEMEKQKVT